MTALLWTLLIFFGLGFCAAFYNTVHHENEPRLILKDSMGQKLTVLIIQAAFTAWVAYLLFVA